MSKSLNNFFTAREILQQYDAEVIRFLMLSAHYRTQLNFSKELMESASASMERLYNAVANLGESIRRGKRKDMKDEEKQVLETLDSFRD